MLSAFGGGRLMGARYGRSPARVVALHGWLRTHADFDKVLSGLDAIALDLPGFGATSPPESAWGASEYAAAVAPALEEVGAPVVLVGHSFGGRVATLLAASRPDLVCALVLSGVPLCRPPGTVPPRPAVAFRAAKVLNRCGLLSDARMEARRQRSGPPDYRAVTGVMRDVFVTAVNETNDGTYTRALATVTCPVAFVWGEQDTAAPPAVADVGAGLVRLADVTKLAGVGHLTPLEAPEELRVAIERHL